MYRTSQYMYSSLFVQVSNRKWIAAWSHNYKMSMKMNTLGRNYPIRLQKSRLKSIEMSKNLQRTEISTEIWSAGKILGKNQSQGTTTMGPPTRWTNADIITFVVSDRSLIFKPREMILFANFKGSVDNVISLVLTWRTISSGFLLKHGLMKCCMSSVVEPE